MRVSIVLFFLLLGSGIFAQDRDSIKHSELSGQFRTFYMSTLNKDSLRDFHSIALGGFIKYKYKFNNHFEAAVAGYVSINTNIQDLSIPDPTTNRLSRYELGLYDLENPEDDFIPVLGELYVRYHNKGHDIKIGRMKVKSPFLNGQDGRMIPTFIQGIWYKTNSIKNTTLQLGLINEISPRSTNKFFSIGSSIGTYPTGRNEDGSPSGYKNNTHSDYLIVTNADYKISKAFKVELWNYFADNLFNSLYIRPSIYLNDNKTTISFEWLNQIRVGDGGNSNDSLRYFTSSKANILGIKFNQKVNKSNFSVAYDYIFPSGRYLFPREWGREFLFSFQKRERTEGFANNHAIVVSYQRNFEWKQNTFNTTVNVGRHFRPTVTDPELNKYAMPDYTHVNLDLYYKHKKLPKLEPELLLTWKPGSGTYPDNPNFIINKVDMFQINLVINYNL
ncbi:OprD family outer membrane porin [Marinigracilibium pacificum]|uniref:OprD family porin n=1 Tax=Marinigracilibium pacificum TaxID=2729599 RepID=A0A848IX87_9BACT|nr:OprD family outer membrane porin [Marinigracilibium pacificum]NMM48266.1 OprD family porin [Marinigracilibium pacificum]